MVNKRGREEASAGAWRVTKRIFEFYVALGLEGERATPRRLGTPVPRTPCLGNGIRQEVR